MKLKRLVAGALALALSVGVLAGCKNEDSGGLTVDGKKVNISNVMEVDGTKITLAEYRYHFLNLKYRYDSGDSSVWTSNQDVAQELKDYVLELIQQNVAIEAIAAEYGIELTDQDKADVDTEMQTAKDEYGSETSWQAALQVAYLTEDLYIQMARLYKLQGKLEDYFFGEGGDYEVDDAKLEDFLQNDYIRAKHVLVSKDTEDAENIAKQVREKALAGENFDDLIEEYGEDPGTANNPDGYYFTAGEMVASFEKAAFALGYNEISEIVETDYGYHIILRLEISDAYVEENRDTIINTCESQIWNDILKQYTEKQEVVFDKNYEKIWVDTLS